MNHLREVPKAGNRHTTGRAPLRRKGRALAAILALLCCCPAVKAQSPQGSLRGRVLDPSGAVIPGAVVTAAPARGAAISVRADGKGRYVFGNLAPGTYTLQVRQRGFANFREAGIVVAPGKSQVVDAHLSIPVENQQVSVSTAGTRVSVAPQNNASEMVIRGSNLQPFSDDPEELQAELEALAGPAAGPGGSEIYVNGISSARIPPKADILSIHVNQNPFSAAFAKLGYSRIEITTKSGPSHFHGELFADGNDSVFNSRDPFVTRQPPYYTGYLNGSVGGPLNQETSFFFYGELRRIQDTAAVAATVLDPSLAPVPFDRAVAEPKWRADLGPQADFHLNGSNFLTARYQFWQNSEDARGVGGFALPSQAYNLHGTDNAVELSDTQVLSPRAVNVTQLKLSHYVEQDTALSSLPTVAVLGAFTGGGNSLGTLAETDDHRELRDVATISLGKHTVFFGGRLEDLAVASKATVGYNGTFTFPSLHAYQITEQGLAQGWPAAQIRAAGGGASQFSIAGGQPAASVNLIDLGLFGEDQWRLRPNLSLNFGLRFETQNHINDHADFAPRVGLAWGLGGPNAKTVLRLGAGIFYDRFLAPQVLQAERLNGVNERQFVIPSPDFFPQVPALSLLAGSASLPTVYRIAPNLTAPYTIQAAASLERQITRQATVSVTYLHSHGVHQLLTCNINAPLPGTYDPANPASGVRPYGDAGNIFQYGSDGLFTQDQLIANVNLRVGARASFFGYYVLNYARSDTNGPDSFVMNPYDLRADYGRAAFDVRHRVFLAGTFALPAGFNLSPILMANSGMPFNITLGQDRLGTAVFNDRPARAAPGATGPGIVATAYGTFDTSPATGRSVIPPYYATGPAQVVLDLRVAKTFRFGGGQRGQGGGGSAWYSPKVNGLGGRGLSNLDGRLGGGSSSESRYSLEFAIAVLNVFNVVNLGIPVGELTSPIFGLSNSLAPRPFSSVAAPRRIDLQLRFQF